MRKFKEGLRHTAEWLLVVVFLVGAVNTAFQPVICCGPVAQVFGSQVALFVYTGAFAFAGLALAASKIWKRKKLHKNSLLGMYLLTIWTTILTLGLVGWGYEFLLSAIDDVIIGLIAAACWLVWKFKTEYINPKIWHHHHRELNDSRN